MAEISKITLPSGNTYDLKDATARSMIAGGISFNIVWTKTQFESTTAPTSTVLANIPKDVVVYYNNGSSSATGTKVAASSTKGTFYLIYSKTQSGVLDKFDEYATIEDGSTFFWEKIGDTQMDLSSLGALAYKDNVTINNYASHKVAALTGASNSSSNVTFADNTTNVDKVLGEATTFTNSSSSVSFSGGTTDKVLGEATTFALSDGAVSFGSPTTVQVLTYQALEGARISLPDVSVTPTTTNIKATASGTAVGANGTAAAITGFGTHSTENFVKSVSADTTKKLVTTTVPNVTGNTSVSIPNVTGNTSVSIPNVTSVGSASTWSFTMGTGEENSETLIISGVNSVVPTLGTNLTATNTTLGTNLTATNTTLGTAKTVATGAATTDGTGAAVVTDITVGESAAAITALGTPTTSNCLTGVKVTTQPTISLATGATAGTGVISVATGISNVTVSGDENTALHITNWDGLDYHEDSQPTVIKSLPTASVGTGITVGTNDKVTAVTGIGTGTAAAQTITVGTNDKVDVLKKGATGTAAAQTITPTTADVLKAESGITAS